jgi:hypothetical protein
VLLLGAAGAALCASAVVGESVGDVRGAAPAWKASSGDCGASSGCAGPPGDGAGLRRAAGAGEAGERGGDDCEGVGG